jgi:tetratricopeptide (TPR) repeat protein
MSLIKRVQAISAVLILCSSSALLASDNDAISTQFLTEKYELFEQLRTAASETEARYAEDAIWQFWFNRSPTKQVRSTLDASLKRREAYDFEAAEQLLSEVIMNAPNYAEGYNQRSFIRFLRENYPQAKQDALKALELEPDHFGALAGLFHILSKQNQRDASLNALQRAVVLHPWIKERFALPKTLWPESYRDIHEPGIRM